MNKLTGKDEKIEKINKQTREFLKIKNERETTYFQRHLLAKVPGKTWSRKLLVQKKERISHLLQKTPNSGSTSRRGS